MFSPLLIIQHTFTLLHMPIANLSIFSGIHRSIENLSRYGTTFLQVLERHSRVQWNVIALKVKRTKH